MNKRYSKAYCNKYKSPFEITFEEKSPGVWHATSTRQLYFNELITDNKNSKNNKNNKNSNDDSTMTGIFYVGEGYVCPVCKNKSYYRCGNCGSINCYDEIAKEVICAKCQNKGIISGSISSLSGDSDANAKKSGNN